MYTRASGQVPMVTERCLTACSSECVSDQLSLCVVIFSERFTSLPSQPGQRSGEWPQLIISYTKAEGGVVWRTDQKRQHMKLTE